MPPARGQIPADITRSAVKTARVRAPPDRFEIRSPVHVYPFRGDQF
jgi:hypothetical protein